MSAETDISTDISIDLADIQSGAFHARPAPYVGFMGFWRIDDRETGREMLRRLLPTLDSAAKPADPKRVAWVSVALTFQGLKALGVPQESLDSFPLEFQEGMAARAEFLGDVGESAPANWEPPFGSPDVHVGISALAPDEARLEAALAPARAAYENMPGVKVIWQQEVKQLPTGRTSFGFRDGISYPGIEGTGIRGTNPQEPPRQGRRVHPRLPRRDGEPAADAAARGAGAQRHLPGVPQAPHQGGGLAPVLARRGDLTRG